MKTIHKYTLESDTQLIEVPAGAQFLTAQVQNGRVCVWAIVDTNQRNQVEHLFIVGTGHPLPEKELQYVGTIQQMGGMLIGHVFRAAK